MLRRIKAPLPTFLWWFLAGWGPGLMAFSGGAPVLMAVATGVLGLVFAALAVFAAVGR